MKTVYPVCLLNHVAFYYIDKKRTTLDMAVYLMRFQLSLREHNSRITGYANSDKLSPSHGVLRLTVLGKWHRVGHGV